MSGYPTYQELEAVQTVGAIIAPAMRSFGVLIAAFFLAAAGVQAQKPESPPTEGQAANTFRLDPRWPFVYLKFDHIGEGARVNDREPSTRIWLHLINNCHVPIVVPGQPAEGGLPNEVFIENEVKLNPPLTGVVSFATQTAPELSSMPRMMLTAPGQSSKRGSQDKTSPSTSKNRSLSQRVMMTKRSCRWDTPLRMSYLPKQSRQAEMCCLVFL